MRVSGPSTRPIVSAEMPPGQVHFSDFGADLCVVLIADAVTVAASTTGLSSHCVL